MEARYALPRATNLRQSYLEISKFLRSRSRHHGFTYRRPKLAPLTCQRHAHDGARESDEQTHLREGIDRCIELFEKSGINASESDSTWESLRQSDIDSITPKSTSNSYAARRVQLRGYLTSQRIVGDHVFALIVDPRLELSVQVVFPKRDPAKASGSEGAVKRVQILGEVLRTSNGLFAHTPVEISGFLARRPPPSPNQKDEQEKIGAQEDFSERHKSKNTVRTLNKYVGWVDLVSHIEVRGETIRCLNHSEPERSPKTGTNFPPELRHQQFRTDSALRHRIRLRSQLAGNIRQHMLGKGFDEIETPLLFKSTPEGAREFVVPTRKKGMAYALPQSPQQYKQVLMASGIPRYFQFARCFRDEDQRSDRQPEFTQLDLEMSFVNAADVMAVVEDLILNAVWPSVPNVAALKISAANGVSGEASFNSEYEKLAFPQMTYEAAMSRYGSDKPDTRLGSEIHRIDHWLPADLKRMVTTLDDPVVEMCKIGMNGCDPAESRDFFRACLDAAPEARYSTDASRVPGFCVFDPLAPLHGLAAFGHEGAARIEEEFQPEPGDFFVSYSRDDKAFSGGSTVLGDLRRDIYQSAISQGLLPAPSGFSPLWITDFPLFSPLEDSEPGQGGSAGICSTHHPFTAPKAGQNLTALSFLEHPLSIIGDHYDLVINGVEVGGGSRRIHSKALQEMILQHALKMGSTGIGQFRHLLKALGSPGCPPHAGFALGFDRLVAMLTNVTSVRDVIAFPKSGNGQDKFVGAPSLLTREQLATYHLAIARAAKDS